MDDRPGKISESTGEGEGAVLKSGIKENPPSRKFSKKIIHKNAIKLKRLCPFSWIFYRIMNPDLKTSIPHPFLDFQPFASISEINQINEKMQFFIAVTKNMFNFRIFLSVLLFFKTFFLIGQLKIILLFLIMQLPK